jgi:hypothetical protein
MPQLRTGTWMGVALVVALMVAGATLAALGTGHDGTVAALQLTARWSYCLFLPAYAGGALVALFGPTFLPLAKQGRNLGLAFASAHLAHIGLVSWLYYISPRPPVKDSTAIFFGIALLFTYVLALFSIPKLASMLRPNLWRLLRTVGMEYIALAFLLDFLQNPFGHGLITLVAYLPFAAIGCAAAVLRISAYAKRVFLRMSHAGASAPRQTLRP